MMKLGTCGFHWWAVEVSNLRPQQCECQKASRLAGVSLWSRHARRAENGTGEHLFTQKLHTADLAVFPYGRETPIPKFVGAP